MDREIKFRAWDKKLKKMAYSGDSDQEYGWFTGNNGCMLCVRIQEERDIKLNNIMQYTGLKDKNGIEIYEGDIVAVLNSKGIFKEWAKEYGYATIKIGEFTDYDIHEDGDYEEEPLVAYGVYLYFKKSDSSSFINQKQLNNFGVIGNIYENPELERRNKN